MKYGLLAVTIALALLALYISVINDSFLALISLWLSSAAIGHQLGGWDEEGE